jgi:hypothetical protein
MSMSMRVHVGLDVGHEVKRGRERCWLVVWNTAQASEFCSCEQQVRERGCDGSR